jgi:hypothetical protein
MLKIIWNKFVGFLVPDDIWPEADPMTHPAIMAMNERELADLPLSAGYYRHDEPTEPQPAFSKIAQKNPEHLEAPRTR